MKSGLFDGDGHLEFFSPEWVMEAKSFLESEIPNHKSKLVDIKFSFAEIATGAPSHLISADKKIGWCFRINHGAVEVEKGNHRGKCDQHVEFDFEEAAAIACITYLKLSQKQMSKIKSKWTEAHVPPQLIGILIKLHDHLAVQTMPRYQAYSTEWVAAADAWVRHHAQLPEVSQKLSEHKGTYTFSEVLTDPPRDLSPNGTPIGFYLRLKDGDVGAYVGIPTDFNEKITMDYLSNNPISTYVYHNRSKEELTEFQKKYLGPLQKELIFERGPKERFDKSTAKLYGKVMAAGGVGNQGLHDFLARHTRPPLAHKSIPKL